MSRPQRSTYSVVTDSQTIHSLAAFLVVIIAGSVIGYFNYAITKASTSFQVASGSYTGNGTSQSITGAGFQPDVVIVKADTNVGKAAIVTSSMPADKTYFFVTSTEAAGAITSIDTNGFSVGANANVNSDTVGYHWVAFTGSGGSSFKVGSYQGNGQDNRSVTGVGFQPDLVIVIPTASSQTIPWYSSSMASDATHYFGTTSVSADRIQALEIDGFQVGTASQVNTNNATYYYVAFKSQTNSIAVGSYVGNGNDGDTTLVTGLAFQPTLAWTQGSTLGAAVQKSAALTGDSSQYFSLANNGSNLIQALNSSGLELGNATAVNMLGGTYYWVAFASNPIPAISSLTPTSGTEGTSVTIAGSNFGAAQGSSTVSFNGTAVTTYTSWSDTEIIVTVPTDATTGDVMVTTDTGTSNGSSFSVYPKITSLSPSSGNIGDTVTIAGLNFESSRGTNTVTFNGIEVTSYTSWNATEIVVVAPSSATGDVVVTTSVGASGASTFSYYPAISSISPTSGSRSTSVTITGSNFGAVRGTSFVSFGSGQASDSNYLLWGNDSILVQVPSGAARGDNSVIVTTSVGASNSKTFNMTIASTTSALTPSIVSVSPTSLDISALAGTSFTITGGNFDKENGVRIQFYLTGVGWFESKQDSTTSTVIKAKFDNVTGAIAGNYYVVVTNIKGGNKAVLEKAFVVSDKTAQKIEVPKKEGVTVPSAAIDNGVIALITEQFGSLKEQYNQVIDLLRSFGKALLGLGNSFTTESIYRYEIDFQAPDLSLAASEEGALTVSVKNTGTATWYKSGTYPVNLGTSNPKDRKSVFATSAWFGGIKDPNRIIALQEDKVAPGQLGTFIIPIQAPNQTGTYSESFKLVAENFTWLTGPNITWTITVK